MFLSSWLVPKGKGEPRLIPAVRPPRVPSMVILDVILFPVMLKGCCPVKPLLQELAMVLVQ